MSATEALRDFVVSEAAPLEAVIATAEAYPELVAYIPPIDQTAFDLVVAKRYGNVLKQLSKSGELGRFREWQDENGDPDRLSDQVADLILAQRFDMADLLLPFLVEEMGRLIYERSNAVASVMADSDDFRRLSPGIIAWMDRKALTEYMSNEGLGSEDWLLDSITRYLASDYYDATIAEWLVRATSFRGEGLDPKVQPSRRAYERMFDLGLPGMCDDVPLNIALTWFSNHPRKIAKGNAAVDALKFLIGRCGYEEDRLAKIVIRHLRHDQAAAMFRALW